MSAKRLLPLALLLVVLIVAAVVIKRQPPPPRLAEETGFERLVPQTLNAESVRAVDLYQGAKPQDVVRLRRQDGAWLAVSYYNAPVQSEKISKFLQAISTLEGELRAEQAELLGDFRLEESQALHLRLYTDNLDTPALHLLAGKSSGHNGFVRLADKTRVYSVNLNVPSEAGLSGNAPEQAPQAKPWVNLQIQDIPTEHITAFSLHTPERTLHFALPPAAAATTGGNTPETTPKVSWQLTAPQVPYPLKQPGPEGLVSALRSLRADDLADPAQLADYGLENPAYRAVLTVQAPNQEARQVSLAVGHTVPEQSGKRYARLDTQERIYILPGWTFSRVFPPAKDLLELPQLAAQAADIQRIAWQRDSESWTLEGHPAPAPAAGETSSTTWRFAEAPQVAVDDQAVQALLDAITQLAIEDWVEQPASPTGLEQPQLVLEVTRHDRQSTRLLVGGARGKDGEGQYANLPDAAGTLIVSAPTYKTLTEALTALHPTDAAAAMPPATPR
jgi:Domain of unknown function (DUF4340)